MNPVYIQCDCHTTYHFLCFEQDEDLPDELTVSFASTRNGSFWHRVTWAFKHVFGRQDLVFADIIIKRKDLADQLKSLAESDGS